MQRPKYRNEYTSYLVIENMQLKSGSESIKEVLKSLEVRGGGDWWFAVKYMEKPPGVDELTLQNAIDFMDEYSTIKVRDNYPLREFLDRFNMNFNVNLQINNYRHKITHENLWDEQSHIFHMFKSKGLTSGEAQELSDKVEEHWELCKLADGKEFGKFLLPGEQSVIPRAFVDDSGGNFYVLLFENQFNQIVNVTYTTS